MVDSAVLLYYKGAYYNTLPHGKKFFIQLRIGQAAGDGVEGEHQMQELTAGKARVDEQEAGDEEDDHVELVEKKVQAEGEVRLLSEVGLLEMDGGGLEQESTEEAGV